jgi:hypothetical protein
MSAFFYRPLYPLKYIDGVAHALDKLDTLNPHHPPDAEPDSRSS